jgi:hypothetical protein
MTASDASDLSHASKLEANMLSARRVIKLSAALGFVGGAMAVSAAPGGSVVARRSIASDTPAQILALTEHATTSAGSVAVDCSAASPSIGLTGTVVTNVGLTVGSQFTTEHVTSLGVATVQTVFIGGVAYFMANETWLKIQFGVAHSKYANKWVSVAKGQKDYAVISSGMTMSSSVLEIAPVGHLSKSAPVTYAGKSAVAVIGKVSPEQDAGTGTQRTYVAIAAPHRPVGLTINTSVDGQTYHGSCTFTKWAHKVVVTKPANSTPITKTGL